MCQVEEEGVRQGDGGLGLVLGGLLIRSNWGRGNPRVTCWGVTEINKDTLEEINHPLHLSLLFFFSNSVDNSLSTGMNGVNGRGDLVGGSQADRQACRY